MRVRALYRQTKPIRYVSLIQCIDTRYVSSIRKLLLGWIQQTNGEQTNSKRLVKTCQTCVGTVDDAIAERFCKHSSTAQMMMHATAVFWHKHRTFYLSRNLTETTQFEILWEDKSRDPQSGIEISYAFQNIIYDIYNYQMIFFA